jgi:hypothetical protein
MTSYNPAQTPLGRRPHSGASLGQKRSASPNGTPTPERHATMRPTLPALIIGLTIGLILGALEAAWHLTCGTILDRYAERLARRT